jgi:hypothetical protein
LVGFNDKFVACLAFGCTQEREREKDTHNKTHTMT